MGQAEPEMGGAAAPFQQPPNVRPTHVERINSGIPLIRLRLEFNLHLQCTSTVFYAQ